MKTIFSDTIFTGLPVAKILNGLNFLGIYPGYELNLIVTLTNAELSQNIFPATTISEIIKLFGVIILITRYEFAS